MTGRSLCRLYVLPTCARQASRLLVIAFLWALPTILHTPITSDREKKRRACLCFLQEEDHPSYVMLGALPVRFGIGDG